MEQARADRRPAVFVDRDGVLNELVGEPASRRHESPLNPSQVRLIPGAAAALRRLMAAGWPLVGVTNQPAAAKGTVPLDVLIAVHERVIELLAAEGVRFEAFELCPHHPQGIVAPLARRCRCRKPAPGMLLDAACRCAIDLRRSWLIGDTDADVAAGTAAGCRTILIENPLSAHKRSRSDLADGLHPSLSAAVAAILAIPRQGDELLRA